MKHPDIDVERKALRNGLAENYSWINILDI